MDIIDKFKIIERLYEQLDAQTKQKHGKPFFDTSHGIWGASSMLDIFEFFMKIKLDGKKSFCDLGSGDGRVVLIASLFTKATGFEAEESLSETSQKMRAALTDLLPELNRSNLIHGDYTMAELHEFDILFTFADHSWSPEFEKKLLQECNGYLLCYNNIFPPHNLKKGKTYWMQQLPIVSYPLNVCEDRLA